MADCENSLCNFFNILQFIFQYFDHFQILLSQKQIFFLIHKILKWNQIDFKINHSNNLTYAYIFLKSSHKILILLLN